MKCQICGKSVGKGMRVSHSHHRTHRKFRANIQKAMVFYKGKWQRLRVCAKCRKKLIVKAKKS